MKLPLALLLVGLTLLPCRGLEVVINEFMATNHSGLTDEDGLTADWIEVRNLTDAPLPLAGWHLTDDPDLLAKWTFPDVTLPAYGYRIVFASSKNRTPTNGNLHTNFNLNEDGEYLALVRPDGHVDHDYSPYPDQFPDISCGLGPNFSSLDEALYYQPASPGAANPITSVKWVGQVPPVEFSHTRGFITNTVAVALSCADPFATILYTLDGSVPSSTNGMAFASPIPISRSDVLRATSIRPGFLASAVRTHTYVMPAEAGFQTHADSLAAGFPPKWGIVNADYGMDPEVVGPGDLYGGRYAATVADDLLAIPSVCLTLPVPDLFGPSGIYANPTQSGPTWERACSLEYLDPSGTGLVFQVNAGVQIIGGASRSFGNSYKKSFRVLFKEDYGGKRLVKPLFGPDAANSFDTLTLRMESNDGFSFKNVRDVQYARDTFARALHRRMGRLAYHSRPVHLYLNGIYWGVYNLGERPDDDFASDYLGGRASDWDVINDGDPPEADNVVNGSGDPARVSRTLGAWTNLVEAAHAVTLAGNEPDRTAAAFALEGRDPDGSPNPALPVHLDLDGYIDYLLLNFWLGNADWPWRNYNAARLQTSNSTGWVFFSWDAEWTLGSAGTTSTNLIGEVHGCAIPFQYLRPSAEFRLRFADRAHRAFKPGGVFYVDPAHPVYDPAHPERNQPAHLYTQVSSIFERPLVAESARWGDQWSAQPLTVDVEWKQTRHTLTNTYFTTRTAVVRQQLRDAGLLPTLEAPVLTPPGGQYAWGHSAEISAPVGTIHYTVNGSDPRMPGGAVDPSAQTAIGPIPLVNQVVIRARAFDGVQWSALTEETFIPELRLALYRPGGNFRLEWNPIQNVAHVVQASPSLVNPAWTNLTTVITNGPAVLEFPAPTAPDGWFFRLQR